MLRYYVLGLIAILVIAGNIGCTKGVPIIESMSSLSDSSGGGTPSDPGIPATPVGLVVDAAFSVASNWNDYIKMSAAGARENVACSSPSNVKYGSAGGCVHGGEIKKVVLPANFTSCVNLSLEDSLGVFNWRCEQTDSAVEFASLLKPGRGLSDLIAPGGPGTDPAWKKNAVTLFYKSTEGLKVVGESTPSVWWGNAIANAPVIGGTLAGSTGDQANVGKIYVVSSDLNISSTFTLDADKIALVTLGSAKISATSLTLFISNWSSPKEYFWLEGKLEGLIAPLMQAVSGKFAWSRFQNLSLKNFTQVPSIQIDSSEGLLIQNFLLRESEKFLITSSYITALDMRISFAKGDGLYLSGANNNSFHRLVVNSTGAVNLGVNLVDSSNNSFSQFAVLHAGANGVEISRVGGTTDNNIFTQGLISKTNGFGLLINASTSGSFINSVVSIDNQSYDFKSYATSVNFYNSVYDSSSFFSAPSWCGFGVGTCSSSGDFTDLTSIQGGFLTNATVNSNYSTLLDAITIGDFFSRLFLSLSFTSSGSINYIGAGSNYSLADWRLNANSPLYLRSFNGTAGDATTKNPESVVNADTGECSGEVAGTVTTGGGQTILYHAIEKAYDGEGDDDGLCEANETCYYAPNIGFYQGDSTIYPEVPHCRIVASNIKILKHGQYAVSGP